MGKYVRAVTSTKLMLQAEHAGDALPAHLHHLAPLVDAAQLEPLVASCLRTGMQRFTADGEVKLTVLVTWDNTVRTPTPTLGARKAPISGHS